MDNLSDYMWDTIVPRDSHQDRLERELHDKAADEEGFREHDQDREDADAERADNVNAPSEGYHHE